MMITINKSILHILDFNSGITVFSEQELDVNNKSVTTFLTKHLEKSFADSNLKSGSFLESSKFKIQMHEYINNQISFVEFSTYIANQIYSTISKSDNLASQDLIVCDFIAESERIIGILLCANRVGFTHQVIKENSKIKNDIINHYAILPNTSQKIDEYAFVDVSSLNIRFFDKKRYIDGQDTFIIPDTVLECSTSISQKDTVKLVNSITQKVAESYGQSSVLAISKVKNYIVENSEVSDSIEPLELSKEVFNSSPMMQEEFLREVRSAGVPEKVKIDKGFAVRAGKSHRIKTDTGIELSFPADYFQNKDYIEFINNSDGTLSIELKNIGKIINK